MELKDARAAGHGGDGTLGGTRQLVTFALGSEEYGIDIAQVQEINRIVPITRIPRAVEHIEGVINLRGQLIPVMDLRTRFGMPRTEATRMSRIIVIESGGRRIGLIVDSVSEVVHVPAADIEPTPEVITIAHPEFLAGIGKLAQRLIILLNVATIVESVNVD